MQQQFVEQMKLRSVLSWRQFRTKLGISNHVHYRYEDCSLSLQVFCEAFRLAHVSLDDAKEYRYRFMDERGETLLKVNHSTRLAELVGICLGDGHLSRYYLAIFGDKTSDTFYLKHHVKPLMRSVLKLTPYLVTKRPDENFLLLNSAAATRTLNRLGLPFGDKIANHARFPKWVLKRKSWLLACLRGLFDTDGCVYGFKRLRPATGSKAIVSYQFGKGSAIPRDVYKALCSLGYAPRMRRDRNECRLAVNHDIERFMNENRPANRKHRANFVRWHGPVV
jgi:hypothetical protein